MKLSVMLRTTEYRGDRDAEVMIAHEVLPGETVMELTTRIISMTTDGRPRKTDVVELRVVKEASSCEDRR